LAAQKNEACMHWQVIGTCAVSEHEIAWPVEVMVAPWQMAPVQSGRWIETSLPQLLAQKRLQSHDPLLPAAATKSSSWPGGQVIGVGVGAAQVRVLQ
jgi:hypothetical protein